MEVATERGMAIFSVQHGGWCAGGKDLNGYKKYGKSDECKDGKGAAWANDVYRITGMPVDAPCKCNKCNKCNNLE